MFTNPEISQNKVPELKVYHHLFENTGSKYIHNQHVKQQTCQLTRAERVGPASEFQTRLTRTVDENENPLETHIAINDEKFPFPPQQLYRWYRRRSCVLKQLILPINYCRKSSSRPDNHFSFANFLLVLGPPCTCHVLSLRHRYHDQELRHPAGGKYCSRFAFTI